MTCPVWSQDFKMIRSQTAVMRQPSNLSKTGVTEGAVASWASCSPVFSILSFIFTLPYVISFLSIKCRLSYCKGTKNQGDRQDGRTIHVPISIDAEFSETPCIKAFQRDLSKRKKHVPTFFVCSAAVLFSVFALVLLSVIACHTHTFRCENSTSHRLVNSH